MVRSLWAVCAKSTFNASPRSAWVASRRSGVMIIPKGNRKATVRVDRNIEKPIFRIFPTFKEQRDDNLQEMQERIAFCETKYGQMRYRLLNAANHQSNCNGHILFIHGLGSRGETCKPPAGLTQNHQWIIPDLLGHGESSFSEDSEGYTMEAQASAIYEILKQQNVTRLSIIAHSMGGPIAVSLCERIRLAASMLDSHSHSPLQLHRTNPPLIVDSIIYAEGNLDRGDCFGSLKIVAAGPPAPGAGPDAAADAAATATAGALYASARDLVAVSCGGGVLPRLRRLMAAGVRVRFVYGERNRGRGTSAGLLAAAGLPVAWVARGGHNMYADPGRDAFWELVAAHLARPL